MFAASLNFNNWATAIELMQPQDQDVGMSLVSYSPMCYLPVWNMSSDFFGQVPDISFSRVSK